MEPFASLASLSRFDVPRVLMNREVVGPFKHRKKRSTDLTVTGDLVQGVWSVAEEAGWLAELEELCGSSWKREKEEKEEREEEDVKSELVGKIVLASYSGLHTCTCTNIYYFNSTCSQAYCSQYLYPGILLTIPVHRPSNPSI